MPREMGISFQKVGGPFKIEQYYYFDDHLIEKDVYVVSKGNKEAARFEINADWDNDLYDPYQSAKRYVAFQLKEQFPEYLNQEAFYAQGFVDEIPIWYLRKMLNVELKEFNNHIDSDLMEFKKFGFEHILDENNKNKNIKDLVAEKIFKKDFDLLAEKRQLFEKKALLYELDKKTFLTSEVPRWYQPMKLLTYKKEENSLKLKQHELKKIESDITNHKQVLFEKISQDKTKEIYRLSNLMYYNQKNYNQNLRVAETMKKLKEKIDLIQNKDQLIHFKMGNHECFYDILDNEKKLNKIFDNILARERTNMSQLKSLHEKGHNPTLSHNKKNVERPVSTLVKNSKVRRSMRESMEINR